MYTLINSVFWMTFVHVCFDFKKMRFKLSRECNIKKMTRKTHEMTINTAVSLSCSVP